MYLQCTVCLNPFRIGDQIRGRAQHQRLGRAQAATGGAQAVLLCLFPPESAERAARLCRGRVDPRDRRQHSGEQTVQTILSCFNTMFLDDPGRANGQDKRRGAHDGRLLLDHLDAARSGRRRSGQLSHQGCCQDAKGTAPEPQHVCHPLTAAWLWQVGQHAAGAKERGISYAFRGTNSAAGTANQIGVIVVVVALAECPCHVRTVAPESATRWCSSADRHGSGAKIKKE